MVMDVVVTAAAPLTAGLWAAPAGLSLGTRLPVVQAHARGRSPFRVTGPSKSLRSSTASSGCGYALFQ